MGRRELLDIAAALAGSFVSRNNDVNGYWSLGLLRSYADGNHVGSLRFDIANGGADPENDLLRRVAEAYRRALTQQLTVRRIAREVVANAEIVLTFDRDTRNAPSAATYGAPFSCTVRLTDRRDREFERTVMGHCGPHDPRRELRSSRAED